MSYDTSSVLPVLRRVFGFSAFRPGQDAVVAAALAGEDVLAVMPTGSGKSLCYQLPALTGGGLTVVVSPLIALMTDQVSQLRALGVAAYALNSGQSAAENSQALRAARSGEARLLYVAPERLLRGNTLELLQGCAVRRLVVDEAHCVSQWGHDFRPEYLELRHAAQAFGDVQLLAFTATADEATRADIAARLFSRPPRVFVHGFDRPNIRLAMAPKDNARRQVLDFVAKHPGESGIVYCATRRETERFAEALSESGRDALPYHAGMEQAQRRENQTRFQQEDGVVMAATIAFGMGIDKPDVRFVCHASMPKSIEAYYQEIGRAGRDGLPADTLTLYGLDDIRLRRAQIAESEAGEDQKRIETHRLGALIALCETPRCRRQTLLAYFGEEAPPCGNCDVCQSGCVARDGTIDAQKAMSAMVRTGERFGMEHLVNILLGKRTDAVERCGHHALPTFGVGKDVDARYWRAVFRQLMGSGLATLDIVNHGCWKVTPKGWAVLRGAERVRMRGDLLDEAPARGKRGRASARPNPVGQVADKLLTALKLLRTGLAKQQDVPAFVIFADRTLLDMAERKPTSLEDMAHIHGVGEKKLAQYGQVFLDQVRKHLGLGAGAGERPVGADPPQREQAPEEAPEARPDRRDLDRESKVASEAVVKVRTALAQAADHGDFLDRLDDLGLELKVNGGYLSVRDAETGWLLAMVSRSGPLGAAIAERFGSRYA
ncbi:ATP-dependent DNA helicase RecQ [Fundidesulfovibrio magnetotacticus]|uniref:DNA helicase RecQ n=1 Tax=Fundidesulfovibrio magnetotacticus TaxID=2730080 RepID=A0A6V8LQ59_9BACT|nr:DNA helicase RecQ [Fundidesulfovibrio magnetotacticus]GFK92468.1 ATP-dependent DNA helicase RecQ [Fundidesulfovibrio magnetotacticus]